MTEEWTGKQPCMEASRGDDGPVSEASCPADKPDTPAALTGRIRRRFGRIEEASERSKEYWGGDAGDVHRRVYRESGEGIGEVLLSLEEASQILQETAPRPDQVTTVPWNDQGASMPWSDQRPPVPWPDQKASVPEDDSAEGISDGGSEGLSADVIS